MKVNAHLPLIQEFVASGKLTGKVRLSIDVDVIRPLRQPLRRTLFSDIFIQNAIARIKMDPTYRSVSFLPIFFSL